MYVLPKYKKDADDDQCLVALLGCSPDELDAVVLAVHGMMRPEPSSMFTVA